MVDVRLVDSTLGHGSIANPDGTEVVRVITDPGGTPASGRMTSRQIAQLGDVGVNAQTGTSYTLVAADKGRVVTMSNAAANVLTIPANSSVAFPVGTIINVVRLGAGVTTIDATTGVTLNGISSGGGAIQNRYQAVALLKIATDTWVASGDIGVVA